MREEPFASLAHVRNEKALWREGKERRLHKWHSTNTVVERWVGGIDGKEGKKGRKKERREEL